ncbi:MAG TPA: orotidine-5'-phosphate decarboxylase [Aggregatilineaceae bacterium]|nr:orotidine-5'-phosphate decarboxylase [Aggregatilineaceae bacterium]
MSRVIAKYDWRADQANSLLCVGLDSDFERLPDRFWRAELPQFAFNRWIIEETHSFVSAYKPNTAFYEARGEEGIRALERTAAYLREHYPDILTICDAKRADIGSTSQGYVSAIFDRMGFDAVTLNPYLGHEALQPFLERQDKGCIILCRTSNPGAGELQDLMVGGKPLWHIVAERVSREWNAHGNCMLVAGATYPEELKRIRALVGEMTLLVPGIGAQGGDVEQTVRAGLNAQGKGLIINSSRGIISADDPAEATRTLRDAINAYR